MAGLPGPIVWEPDQARYWSTDQADRDYRDAVGSLLALLDGYPSASSLVGCQTPDGALWVVAMDLVTHTPITTQLSKGTSWPR